MSTPPEQTIAELIKVHERFLILFPKLYDGDHLASALALTQALKRLNKEVQIVCQGFELPEKYHFLPESETVEAELSNPKKFLIQINTEQTPLEDMSYEMKKHVLNIYITPKNDFLQTEHIKLHAEKYQYDVIFILGATSLETLGFDDETLHTFFKNKTIINIGRVNPEIEFTPINYIETDASSLAEVLYSLLIILNPKFIDTKSATCLLTGIFVTTNSFRSSRVNPRTLQIASQLIEQYQAQQKDIIKNLYYNRSIATLNLWGTIMTKLNEDQKNAIVWANITTQDFTKTASNPDSLSDIFQEFIVYIPNIKIAALFYEMSEQNIVAHVRCFDSMNLLEIFKDYQPKGTAEHVQITFINTTLVNVENKVIQFLKEKLTPKTDPMPLPQPITS